MIEAKHALMAMKVMLKSLCTLPEPVTIPIGPTIAKGLMNEKAFVAYDKSFERMDVPESALRSRDLAFASCLSCLFSVFLASERDSGMTNRMAARLKI